MRRSQVGLLLVAAAVFIPLVLVPFTEGYRPAAGLIQNIQQMTLTIRAEKYEPRFTEVKPTDSIASWPFVDISPVGELSPEVSRSDYPVDPLEAKYAQFRRLDPEKVRFFPNGHPDDEIAKALKAGKSQIERSKGKYLMFHGWTVSRPGVHLRFAHVVSASLLLAFIGVALLILTQKQKEKPA